MAKGMSLMCLYIVKYRKSLVLNFFFQVVTKSAYQPHDATVLPVYNPLPGSWFAAAYIPNWNEQMQQEVSTFILHHIIYICMDS